MIVIPISGDFFSRQKEVRRKLRKKVIFSLFGFRSQCQTLSISIKARLVCVYVFSVADGSGPHFVPITIACPPPPQKKKLCRSKYAGGHKILKSAIETRNS